MYTTALRTVAVLALASHATADVIRVDVGKNGLTFNPDTVTAKMGDMIEYHFFQPNHTSTEGTLDNPCQPKDGGFFSGFMVPSGSNSEADNVFQVMINDTDPKFVYCSQNIGSHCKTGMAQVINPSGNQTLKAFQDGAKSVSSAGAPDSVSGGSVVAASKAQATNAPSSTAVSSSSSGGGGGGGGLYGGGPSTGSSSSDAGQIAVHLSFVGAIGFGVAAMML